MLHPRRSPKILFLAALWTAIPMGCGDAGPSDPRPRETAPILTPIPKSDLVAVPEPSLQQRPPNLAVEPDDALVVMSWNLENFPLTPQTPGAVEHLLDQHQPDVVALQEIADVDAFEALVDALPAYDGMLNDDEGAFQRVGVLVRSDRVTVDRMETLFAEDWYAFPRPPLRVGLTWRNERGAVFDFSLVTLHLKAMIDEKSAQRRRAACERLDQWVREDLQRPDADPDILIVGDWNDELTDPAEENVFSAMLDQPEQYRFLTDEAAEQGAYSYIPFEKLIDHVAVTTDALVEYGDGSTVVLQPDQDDPSYREAVSDHRPVVSRFRVTAQ